MGFERSSARVPVKWADIAGAKVVVETGIEGYSVDALQGIYFFHNLVAMNAGYFTVPHKSRENFVEWKWLKKR